MDPLLALTLPNWMHQSGNVLANTVCWIVIAIGFVFTFLPIVPGQVLIAVGGFMHYFWLGPEHGMSPVGLGILVVILVLSFVLDYVAGAAGAKKFGATKWGIWGALAGGIIGIFLGPLGLLLGPLLGAVTFELLGGIIGALTGKIVFSRRNITSATKSGYGTVLGTIAGIILKGISAILMVATILADIWWKHPLEGSM